MVGYNRERNRQEYRTAELEHTVESKNLEITRLNKRIEELKNSQNSDQTQKSSDHKKFEYKQFNYLMSTKKLNELGEDGWDLISFNMTHPNNYCGQSKYFYLFKKEI